MTKPPPAIGQQKTVECLLNSRHSLKLSLANSRILGGAPADGASCSKRRNGVTLGWG